MGDRRATRDRRARRVSLRYPERRTGFDRRRRRPVLEAYRRRPGLFAGVLAAIVALSAADLLLTLRALDRGAVELNPLMAALLSAGTAPTAAFKLGSVSAVAAAMWATRRYRLVLQASLALVALMAGVVAYLFAGMIVTVVA